MKKITLILTLLIANFGYSQDTDISVQIFAGETYGVGVELEYFNFIKSLDLVVNSSYIGSASINNNFYDSSGQEALIGARYYLKAEDNKGLFFTPLFGYASIKYTDKLNNATGKHNYIPYGLDLGYKFKINKLSLGLKTGFFRKMKLKYTGIVNDNIIDDKGFRVGLFAGYSF